MSKQGLILIDAGHGGLVEGKYTTYPNKRVERNADQINEGVLNRAIASLLAFRLDFQKIPCQLITPENSDVTLSTRIKRVNKLHEKYNCVLISIHHNYYPDPKVKGAEIFTSRGETTSDLYAELMAGLFLNYFPNNHFRKHSQIKKTKEAGYAILRKTKCPAILTEFGFMSNADEYYQMASNPGITTQVNWLCTSSIEIYNKHLKL